MLDFTQNLMHSQIYLLPAYQKKKKEAKNLKKKKKKKKSKQWLKNVYLRYLSSES